MVYSESILRKLVDKVYRVSVLSPSLRFLSKAQWDVVLLLLLLWSVDDDGLSFPVSVATAYFPERTEIRLSLPNVMRRTGLILVWCDLRVVGRLSECVITSVIVVLFCR